MQACPAAQGEVRGGEGNRFRQIIHDRPQRMEKNVPVSIIAGTQAAPQKDAPVLKAPWKR
jgi:hypothetical protein